MNVGGPAYNVSVLGGRLDPDRFDTLLVHGRLGPGEGSFEWLAEREGCRVHVLPDLGPEIRPGADARAVRELMGLMRRFRPHVVHTHTAKAGFVGRLAAVLSRGPRPVIVHTYHGHVLEGYFGPAKNLVYRGLERGLGRASDALLGVSQATVDDLVRLRVAPRERFRVLPIGLDLARFADPDPAEVADFRARTGTADGELLLGCVGRLAPIKRVDVLLHAFAVVRSQGLPARLAIVGDGECRGDLETLAGELGIGDAVSFMGFMADSAPAAAAADIAVLSSDNEGTPVALIEASAAATPAAATAVGGVVDVVGPSGGTLVAPGDPIALADAIARLAADPARRAEVGARAQAHVLERFSAERLVSDVEDLYEELLGGTVCAAPGRPAVRKLAAAPSVQGVMGESESRPTDDQRGAR
jgi:glycosyltransferase involved in cell wall biosynthesis